MDRQLESKAFYDALTRNKISYFCGVPDSLVSPFSLFLEATAKSRHTIAANEGNAIGLAIGYHVATGKIPLVYMQNSGLGNAIDPLVSLVDPSVLSVPMVLLISWRGQPNKKDEPQHVKQGAITTELLNTLAIPHQVLSRDSDEAAVQVRTAAMHTQTSNSPYALLVEKDTFAEFTHAAKPVKKYPLSREQAIKTVLTTLETTDIVIASIGKISREVFEYRDEKNQGHEQDLLVVGGMGHASSIALGIAQQQQKRSVYCLDGDGSVLMHMGSLATIGSKRPNNFIHIVFNNGLHDSVGGQPTAGFDIDLPGIAKACGYAHVFSVHEMKDIQATLVSARTLAGPLLIEIRVHGGARPDLIRPTIHPESNKQAVTAFLARQ